MSLNEIEQRKNAARFLEALFITVLVIILSIVVLAVNSVVKTDILIHLVIAGCFITFVGLGSRYKDFKDLLKVIKHSSSGGPGVAR